MTSIRYSLCSYGHNRYKLSMFLLAKHLKLRTLFHQSKLDMAR